MAGDEGFSIAARARSFAHAFRGVRVLLATQHNAWIHAAATALVLAAGLAFDLTRLEWCAIALAAAAVWTAEGLNTALEALGDVASRRPDPLVGRAKDVAAGAVLLAAAGAALVGLLIFAPRLLALWR
jgi:diacylglycerol kinase (ATP)